MNIAHIVFGMTIGGIETMLVNIANCQSKCGHKVGIFIINDIIDNELLASLEPDVLVERIAKPYRSKNPFYLFRLNHRLNRFRPDAIHLHKANILKFLAPRYRKMACVTQHEIIVDDDLKPISKISKRFSISQAVADDLRERLGLESTVVPNGVDKESFKLSADVYKAGQKLNCVCVGRVRHLVKGQHILVQAFARLVERGIENIHLDIVGEGASVQYLEKLIGENGLESFISLKGAVTQARLKSMLRKYDLFILPSLSEGFGLSVLEAMCARVPVMVSDLKGPLSIIGNGKAGYVFRAGDSGDCADKLEAIIKEGIPRSMIDMAEMIASKYDISATAAKYIELYG